MLTKKSILELGYGEAEWNGYQQILKDQKIFAELVWDSFLEPLKSKKYFEEKFEKAGQIKLWNALVNVPIGKYIEENIKSDILRGVIMTDAKIGPELIESLGSGLRAFGEKVSAISNTADISVATSEFTTKIKSASSRFEQLSVTFDKASADIAEMAETTSDSKAYHEQVNSLTKNLATLNAVYELELQDSNAHLKSMNKFYQNIALTMKNFNDSMEDSTKFKEEVGKLAKNLASMNAIYGNMLTAMSQSRG